MAASLTDRELDVMAVLWERGSGTVAEVKAALRDELAYTTVLTVLRILEAKGHVRHEGEGRAHRRADPPRADDAHVHGVTSLEDAASWPLPACLSEVTGRPPRPARRHGSGDRQA